MYNAGQNRTFCTDSARINIHARLESSALAAYQESMAADPGCYAMPKIYRTEFSQSKRLFVCLIPQNYLLA
jgi:hypothetical protein